MKKAGMVPPTFESDHTRNQLTVRLLLHHFLCEEDVMWFESFAEFELSDEQKLALVFVREVRAIDNITYRQLSGVKTSRDLSRMANAHLIEIKKHGNQTYYVLGKELQKRIIERANIGIKEETGYPFNDVIKFTVSIQRPAEFSLLLRIPLWAKNAYAVINGSEKVAIPVSGIFSEIRRTFKDGDTVELHLPMESRFTEMPFDGISIERGPLLYALPVEADEKTVEMREHNGVTFTSKFMIPASQWNYGFNAATGIEVNDSGDYSDLWNVENTPVRIKVNASAILNWRLYRGVFTPDMPSILNIGDSRTIELVPMGTTQLRISVFPDTSEIPILRHNLK